MSTDKSDPKNPTEVLPKDAKTELTEQELAKASGGFHITKKVDVASPNFFLNSTTTGSSPKKVP